MVNRKSLHNSYHTMQTSTFKEHRINIVNYNTYNLQIIIQAWVFLTGTKYIRTLNPFATAN